LPAAKAALEGPALQPRGVLHAHHDALLQLFPDARHAKEDGGCDLAQVDRNGVDRLGVVHHAAGHHVHDGGEGAFGHVAQGQVAQHLHVVLVEPEMAAQLVGGHDQVAVRQHRALGRPGGARGVDEHAGVVGLRGGNAVVEGARLFRVGRGVLVAEFEHVLEGHQHLARVQPHALHVDGDDLGDVGQADFVLGDGVQHLVNLLLVAADHEAAVRVVDDVLQLGPRVGRVDADHHAADGLRAQVGEHPLGRVFAGDGQPVAAAETQRQHAQREAARGVVVMAPTHPVPDAQVLLAESQRVGRCAGPVLQQLGQRMVAAVQGFVQGFVLEIAHAAACAPPR
jgi:hypothetical protein